ncbi:MAG: F0F1 ATP synthase subunit A [Thermodesulfovibrionales bacterium]|nr:F0F1 ATP synthase subunit A [Thermodesulfovibrionales bacterium]
MAVEALHETLLMDAIINPEVIPHNVSHALLASVILIVVALIIRTSVRLVPRGIQNFMEVITEAILKLVEDNIGHRWGRQVFSFICTIFIFILLCNFMGLIPGFASATANVNTNAAMAVPVFIAYQFYGIRIHGIKYIYHFLGPIRSIAALPLMILMFVVEFISHLARPFTLTIRLFGNMTAKHVLLLILAIIAPWIFPTLILGLGVLVAIVQAFVFTLLSVCYFAGAVEEAH